MTIMSRGVCATNGIMQPVSDEPTEERANDTRDVENAKLTFSKSVLVGQSTSTRCKNFELTNDPREVQEVIDDYREERDPRNCNDWTR
ncbi:MAG: hypothetical protein Q9159_005215 [Coniocarpon cinnabarinum]